MSAIFEADTVPLKARLAEAGALSGGSVLELYSKTRHARTSAYTCTYTHVHRYAFEGG